MRIIGFVGVSTRTATVRFVHAEGSAIDVVAADDVVAGFEQFH
jgi:hypothetical protein